MGENAVIKVFTYILAIVFMAMVPTLIILHNADTVMNAKVAEAVQNFTDTCRRTDCISSEAYNEFTDELADTGYTYSINITVKRAGKDPITVVSNGEITTTSGHQNSSYSVDPDNISEKAFYTRTINQNDDLLPGEYEVAVIDEKTQRVVANSYELLPQDEITVTANLTEPTVASIISSFLTFGTLGDSLIHAQASGLV